MPPVTPALPEPEFDAWIAGPTGYADAFYEIAKLLGIGARSDTPANVFKNEMLPKLERLKADAERYRWLRSRPLDDDEIFIAVDSVNHPGRWGLGGSDPDGCDAAIDAARAALQEQPPC